MGRLEEVLRGSDMVFVAAGMGGGTGTGAGPIIAQVARDVDALTVGVVTQPFRFEGRKRSRLADEGIMALAEEVDSPSLGATRAPAPSDGLLALQEVPDAVARNARGRRRGEDLLDRLDELRLALLTGRLSPGRIHALSAMVAAQKEQVTDPGLSQILEEIELRAAVELAKLGH